METKETSAGASEMPQPPKTSNLEDGGDAGAGFGEDAHPQPGPAGSGPRQAPTRQITPPCLWGGGGGGVFLGWLVGCFSYIRGKGWSPAERKVLQSLGVSRQCGWKTGAQRLSRPPPTTRFPRPAPKFTPRKASDRGLLKKTFCGEETSFLRMRKKKNPQFISLQRANDFPSGD